VITYDDKYKSAQKLKAGSTLTISVNVAGSPTPKVSWSQAGEPVTAASIDTKDNQSTLTVKNITAKVAGQIQVKAENKVGADTAEFTVEIKGFTNAFDSASLTDVLSRLYYFVVSLRFVSGANIGPIPRRPQTMTITATPVKREKLTPNVQLSSFNIVE